MAVSIKDIARVAGVSHSTVSRALRGSALIPAATTGRIQQIANEMGYTASAIGRGLVKGRTEAIGVVVTSIADPFNSDVVAGLEEVANQHGYSVILATSQAVPEREISVVKSFQSRRVDGIIVASSRVGSNYSNLLAELKIPVVLLNNQSLQDEAIYSVCIDNRLGTYDATRHLLNLGHRRIAYLGDRLGLHSDTERQGGFMQAMDEAGAEVTPDHLLCGDGKMEGAAQAVIGLWDQAVFPTAIVCYNDMSAIGVMQVAKDRQVRIPDQLSIVGFDDIQVSALVNPALTTVHQPKKELGAHSMSLMLKLLRGEEAERSLVLPGKLIERGSTSRPPHQLTYQSISAGKNSATKSS